MPNDPAMKPPWVGIKSKLVNPLFENSDSLFMSSLEFNLSAQGCLLDSLCYCLLGMIRYCVCPALIMHKTPKSRRELIVFLSLYRWGFIILQMIKRKHSKCLTVT